MAAFSNSGLECLSGLKQDRLLQWLTPDFSSFPATIGRSAHLSTPRISASPHYNLPTGATNHFPSISRHLKRVVPEQTNLVSRIYYQLDHRYGRRPVGSACEGTYHGDGILQQSRHVREFSYLKMVARSRDKVEIRYPSQTTAHLRVAVVQDFAGKKVFGLGSCRQGQVRFN